MEIHKFQQFIFDWWKKNKRDLPWRHTHDPYKILVSEVMLQQTQVFRVIPKYAELVEAYPTAAALANAPVADVLRIWKGLGYNRRALYLQKAAQAVSKTGFPRDAQALQKLPGIGLYTARAILVFAFKQDIAMVDTNIRQIITHFFFNDIPQPEKIIQDTADTLVPTSKSWEWHQALMDYGALALKKSPAFAKASAGKQKPFKNSNRFYRGEIMNILRNGKTTQQKLKKILGEISETRLQQIILSLLKDKLVEKKRNLLSLPGEL